MHAIGHRLIVLLAAAVLGLAAAAVHAHHPPGDHCDDDAISRAGEAGGIDLIGADSHLHCHHNGCVEVGAVSSPPRIDPLLRPETARFPARAETVAHEASSGYAIRAIHTRLYILFESLLI